MIHTQYKRRLLFFFKITNETDRANFLLSYKGNIRLLHTVLENIFMPYEVVHSCNCVKTVPKFLQKSAIETDCWHISNFHIVFFNFKIVIKCEKDKDKCSVFITTLQKPSISKTRLTTTAARKTYILLCTCIWRNFKNCILFFHRSSWNKIIFC